MVHQFFTFPTTRQRMQEGPLGPYINEYAALLHEQGYCRQGGGWQIRWVADLSRWMQQRGVQARDLTPPTVARYLRFRKRRWRPQRSDHSILKRYLTFLRHKGVLPPEAPSLAKSARERVEENFELYLFQERGLSRVTVVHRLPFIRRFLVERFGQKPIRFERLRTTDITGYVRRHARDFGPKRAAILVSTLRSFLRYLRHQGLIATDLAACVPAVAAWRLSTVPKFLSPNQVQHVLEDCDRTTPQGRRNYAILMLLARLGLRAGEVVNLTLDDIRWSAGEITVQGKGGRQARLPLPQKVGQALADYLKKGRPSCSSRRVFIRSQAPRQGFPNGSAVTMLVRRALERAGVSSARKGAHLFRHSLATNMLRRGASLAEIGQILRHRGLNTTAIYAKVDFDALLTLAQPWPGGVR